VFGLIAFSTGGDGVYTFRLTGGLLTRRQQRWRTRPPNSFLYTAHHRESLLDNGSSSALDLPKGHYRVTLHAISRSEEPGVEAMPSAEQLPSNVTRFEPVSDPSKGTRSPGGCGWTAGETPSKRDFLKNRRRRCPPRGPPIAFT
jgi:hypothetical protein